MAAFVIKRLVWAVVLMIVISAVTYILFFVAASPNRERTIGTGATSLSAQFEVVGKPVFEQYARFLWAIVRHGELGHSFTDDRPVTDILADAVPVTASLVIGGSILFMMIAFPIGILSALRPRSLLDRLSMVFVLIGVSAHPVWIGLMLSYFVGAKWHLTPVAGYCDFFNPAPICGGAVDWASHMMLPWITFACLFAALYARMVRASVLETLGEDYVRTAVAKGAGSGRVLRVHVLRNALLPVITMIGMDIGIAFGGVVFIETVFGLPGVGNRMFRALPSRDLPVMMGVVLVVSLAVVVMNLIIDLLYPLLNPRVGLTGTGDVPFRLRRSRAWTEDEPPDISGSARPPTPARTASAAVPHPAGPAPSRRRTGSP